MPDNINPNTLVGKDDFACFCIHTSNKYYLGEKKRKDIQCDGNVQTLNFK